MDVGLWSEQGSQVAPAINDADDLDGVYLSFIGVGKGLVENEVRGLDKHAGGKKYLRVTFAQPRILNQPFGS